jgi:hypothetical protein
LQVRMNKCMASLWWLSIEMDKYLQLWDDNLYKLAIFHCHRIGR